MGKEPMYFPPMQNAITGILLQLLFNFWSVIQGFLFPLCRITIMNHNSSSPPKKQAIKCCYGEISIAITETMLFWIQLVSCILQKYLTFSLPMLVRIQMDHILFCWDFGTHLPKLISRAKTIHTRKHYPPENNNIFQTQWRERIQIKNVFRQKQGKNNNYQIPSI